MGKVWRLLLLVFVACGFLKAQTVISNVFVQSSTATTATIVWTTSTPANSQIRYGTTPSLTFQTNVDLNLVTSHQMVLTVLNASQPYYFAVLSRDSGGQLVQSPTQQFALCSSSSQATVPVTGTLSIPYGFGTYTLTWIPPVGASATPTTCGQPMASPVTGSLDQMGSMINAVVNDSLRTTPGPGTWNLQVADPGSIAAVNINIAPSFQSNQFTDQLRAAAQPLGLINMIATPTQCYYPWACGQGPGGMGPGGSDEMVQYNKLGKFGGDAALQWDYTNSKFAVGGFIPAGTPAVTIGPHGPPVSSWTFDVYSPQSALLSVLAGATGCSSTNPLVRYDATCTAGGGASFPGVTPDGSNGLNVSGNITAGPATTSAIAAPNIGGSCYAKQWQTGAGYNGISNATAGNCFKVVSDPTYMVSTTANMSISSKVITVANAAGIVPGMWISGNVQSGNFVMSVAGNSVTLYLFPLSTNPSVQVYFFENPYRPYNGQLPLATNYELDDHHLGWATNIKRDPGANPVIGRTSFNFDGCYSTKRQNWAPQGQSNETCKEVSAWYAAPSNNFSGLWGVTTGLDIFDVVNQRGIGELISAEHSKSGIGDGPLLYYYYTDYLGSVAGSDEGQGGPFIAGGEAPTTTVGTVLTGGGGTGATRLSINCTSDCSIQPSINSGGPGDGRYMVDKTGALSFNMTAVSAPVGQTPGTITTDTTIPVSTFWGVLAAAVNTPISPPNAQGVPLSDGTTDMTFTVNAAPAINGVNNSGSPQVGDLVCFSWNYHEQAKIKAVNSGTFPGPWSITVPLRLPHPLGAWIFSNGTCGSFVDLTANDVPTNSIGSGGYPLVDLHYPFDSIGSIGSNTLAYTWFSTYGVNGNSPSSIVSSGAVGRAVLPVSIGGSATNNGGVVVLTGLSAGNQFIYFYQPVVYISGANDSAYNGPCYNTIPAYLASVSGLQCSQTTSNGHASSTFTSGQISIGTTGYGNTAGVLWKGAEVLDILDYNQANCAALGAGIVAPCFDNKNYTLEPNNAAWANGDAVEQPHHYSSQIKASKQIFDDFDTYQQGSSDGWVFRAYGPGVCCAYTGNPTGNRSLFEIDNSNAVGFYQGHGGTTTPVGGINLGSFVGFNYGLNMQYAPEPNALGKVISVGCPALPAGCGDKTYSYRLFDLNSNTSGGQNITFNPNNSDIIIGNGNASTAITWNGEMNGITMRDNLTFAPIATPVLTVTPQTSGGALADGTYCYFVIAHNHVAFNPYPTQTCVAISGGGGSGSVALTWGRISGATSYYVCGRTSGVNNTVAALGGADSNWFTDTGGTLGGSCPSVGSITNGSIDQAGQVGFNSGTTSFEITMRAPNAMAANTTLTLPTATGTLSELNTVAASANVGLATLAAGTVTVTTTSACTPAASCVVMLTNCGVAGTQGMLSVGTVTAGTSFIINSSNAADTSKVCWRIN